jgi:hypothetical protein
VCLDADRLSPLKSLVSAAQPGSSSRGGRTAYPRERAPLIDPRILERARQNDAAPAPVAESAVYLTGWSRSPAGPRTTKRINLVARIGAGTPVQTARPGISQIAGKTTGGRGPACLPNAGRGRPRLAPPGPARIRSRQAPRSGARPSGGVFFAITQGFYSGTCDPAPRRSRTERAPAFAGPPSGYPLSRAHARAVHAIANTAPHLFDDAGLQRAIPRIREFSRRPSLTPSSRGESPD